MRRIRTSTQRKFYWGIATLAVLYFIHRHSKQVPQDGVSLEDAEERPFDVNRRPQRFAYPPAKSTPKYNDHLTPPKDFRAKECLPEYDRLSSLPMDALPDTTVIFCFCNEPQKSLFNSIFSVIERSPRHLLKEFVLVDDGSDAPHLQGPLEDFVKTLPVPVKIVRQGYRSGLMRARVAGARVATGTTLTFLDSHISCSVGWLEPLMYRIAQGREHVVMPCIDGIDRDWHYKPGGVELVGFNTHLVDHGIRLQKAHDFPGRTAVDPQPSPAMAGGLFSIHREYFFEIGAFDEGMLHWGGENIEIGFRVWQCGGSIELISCSRVGHVWGGMGANCGWKGGSPSTRNKWRAIEVWMDPHHQEMMKHFLPYPAEGTGNLSIMMDIKNRLKCESFDWFLEHVYPECWMKIVEEAPHKGLLRNVATRKCIDPRNHGGPALVDCSDGSGRQGNNQFLYLTTKSELLLNAHNADIDSCLEAPFEEGGKLSIYGCHGFGGNQEWRYGSSDGGGGGILKHGSTCLEGRDDNTVVVATCSETSGAQHWEWVALP